MDKMNKKLKVFFAMFTATIVFMVFIGIQPLEAKNLGTVDICHWNDEEGIFKHIKISTGSQQAHIDAHGDKEYIAGADCNDPAPPWRFAIAFINVDGVPGYDDFVDILIAKLVDTNGNHIVDAGDTVVTDSYPLNRDPCRGSVTQCLDVRAFKVNTQIITETFDVQQGGIGVEWKGMQYLWFDTDFLDIYREVDVSATSAPPPYFFRGTGVELNDEIRAGSAEGDKLAVGDRSPSRATEETRDDGDSNGLDDNFLDVEVNLPNP